MNIKIWCLSGCIQKQQKQYNQTEHNITGTDGYGVALSAYSSNDTTHNPTEHNITGTYDGVDLYAYSSNDTTHSLNPIQHHRNIWCCSVCRQQQQKQYNQN